MTQVVLGHILSYVIIIIIITIIFLIQAVLGHIVSYMITSFLAVAGNFLVILAILLSGTDAKFLNIFHLFFCALM